MNHKPNLAPDIIRRIETWLRPPFDPDTRQQLQQLIDDNNYAELQEAFYTTLDFGTGGLRGIMGVGTNRMNRYTIGLATYGLAHYLKEQFPNQAIRVAIAYDSRHNSQRFARIAAEVFSAYDIEVLLFEELRPTPLLSFAIRHLNCHGGVVITASHNPPEYNGYKAYWVDGSQLTAPHDRAVMERIRSTSIESIRFDGKPEYIRTIGRQIDEQYLAQLCKLSKQARLVQEQANMPIVYTPLHGTGITLVPELLQRWGFKNIHIVDTQATPDGNFPTVTYPNPEEADALQEAIRLAECVQAELVLANDPDADRVGIAVPDDQGKFILLNGNQTACLLLYYLIQQLPPAEAAQHYIVKTIVSTPLLARIANAHHVHCFDTLTGFKHIAAIMRQQEGKLSFLMAAEESYGYLVQDFVRDKDGVSACALIAEAAAWAKVHFGSLYRLLLHIYQTYGLYQEGLLSITRKGIEGQQAIQQMMQRLRQSPPKEIAGSPVIEQYDYLIQQKLHMADHSKVRLDNIPASNVLQFVTADGTWVSVRPSGTEPKIKFYFSVMCPLNNTIGYAAQSGALQKKIRHIQQELMQLLE